VTLRVARGINVGTKGSHLERRNQASLGEIAMRRYFGWAFLVAAGLVLGVVSNSYERTSASPPTASAAADDAVNAEIVAELKEIKAQLKEISTHLRTGTTRVFVNMNPN
jgi:hypothetical protein